MQESRPTADVAATHSVKNYAPSVFFAVVCALALVYFAALARHRGMLITISWGAIGLGSVGAIVFGVIKNKPTAKLPWLLLALATLLFISGDVYFKYLHFVAQRENPFPSFADALYLSTYPLFAVGLYLLVRKRTPVRNGWGSLLEALILTASLLLLVWVYLVLPNARADAAIFSRLVSIAYPIGDVLLWALLVRLLAIDVRTRAVQFLGVGALGLIASDIIYGLGQFYGFWHEGNPVDIGWILFYGLWGTAALHPSMVTLSQRLSNTEKKIHARRLIILAAAAFVAPIVLLVETLRGQTGASGSVIAVFAAILFLLVFLRLYILSSEIGRRDTELRLSQEKNEITAIASHELRTPLTIIGMYSEMLAKSPQLTPEQHDHYMSAIAEANKDMVEIVNTLLYTTQLDLEQVSFKIEPVAIGTVVQAAIQANEPLIKEKGVQLDMQIAPDLPMIQTAPAELLAALRSIIDNAARYASDNPQMHVQVRAEGGAVHITVADNGHGVPEEEHEKIFTKLFRASNARRFSPDGMGLGLYLSKQIVERLNGTISFESSLEKGTTVQVSLPLVP